MIHVHVDAVGDGDIGGVSAEAQLAAEEVKQNKHYDNQQDNREDAAASASTGLHYGRPLAVSILAIIGHRKLSLFTLLLRNERTAYDAVPDQRGTMKSLGMLALALLASCSSAHEVKQGNNSAESNVASNTGVAAVKSNGVANATLGEDRTPLAEPKGPIDPKSAEAAGQVVQHYGALIEQRRFEEAEKLWNSAAAASQLRAQLAPYPEIHLQVGKPGKPEGAAGSIYMTVPAVFYGKDQTGAPLRVTADVILRRVNDVTGSTEAQRRWHIERVDWKKAG